MYLSVRRNYSVIYSNLERNGTTEIKETFSYGYNILGDWWFLGGTRNMYIYVVQRHLGTLE
jgi:hypothetical protein